MFAIASLELLGFISFLGASDLRYSIEICVIVTATVINFIREVELPSFV